MAFSGASYAGNMPYEAFLLMNFITHTLAYPLFLVQR